MKFAQFNHLGLPTAFYDPDINGDAIPDTAVEISDEQYSEFINNNGLRQWQEGQVAEYSPPPPSDEEIAARRDAAIQSAMAAEADPLFFKYQAGETTKAVWLAKRQEIKDRFAA